MLGHVRLSVKFRFMRMDLAKIDKQWTVTIPDFQFTEEGFDTTPPVNSKKLLDRNGVRIHVWKD